MSLLIGAVALFMTAAAAPRCEPIGLHRITGYAVGDYPGLTYDGTSTTQAIARGEKIAAASWDIPIGTRLRVQGLDYSYRVADRGMLGSSGWIDVLVKDRATAYKLAEWVGGTHANVCVERWGG
jgi:3D (Asp-Asp-Asp) domain-containing protein